MFIWYTPIVISLISSTLSSGKSVRMRYVLSIGLLLLLFDQIVFFKYIFNSLSIFAFQSIPFAISFDAVSIDNVRGLKQFSNAQTILTKSLMSLTNLSRNLHCLIRPLALTTTHLTFVINLDLFACSVVCFFCDYIPNLLDIKWGHVWLNELGIWI